jgi:hypothetical protein
MILRPSINSVPYREASKAPRVRFTPKDARDTRAQNTALQKTVENELAYIREHFKKVRTFYARVFDSEVGSRMADILESDGWVVEVKLHGADTCQLAVSTPPLRRNRFRRG